MRPRIIGTGSFVPETRVTNEQYLEALRPVNSKTGRLVRPEWLRKYFGIETRAYDALFPAVTKLSREEGGLYDGDLAVRAARAAMEDAGVSGSQIDVLIHVSCTPDTNFCSDHLRFITMELGLRADTGLIFHNLGCAGMAPALRSANVELYNGHAQATALVVASNCPSGYLSREVLAHYSTHPYPWAWLSPAVFGDAGAAMVLQLNEDEGCGFIHTWYETHPEVSIVEFPAGGALYHTRAANVGEHLFLMDAKAISEQFVLLMQRNVEKLMQDWPRYLEPSVGHAFDVEMVSRWYIHQANGVAVKQVADAINVPLSRVPININQYGNTCAASTLLLFDEDRQRGCVNEGDLVVFLWIGAGNGAMNGYAVYRL